MNLPGCCGVVQFGRFVPSFYMNLSRCRGVV
jgi:hypothetical protein